MGKKVYSEQFKSGAVDQVIVQRHTMSSVAKRLGVDYHTLRGWVVAAKSGSATSTIPASLSPDQRIRELEKERDRSTNHTPRHSPSCFTRWACSTFHRSGSQRSRSVPLACGTFVNACVR
jgi:transposase-like protein